MYALWLLQPSRRQERLHQWWSSKASLNQVFEGEIWRTHRIIQTMITPPGLSIYLLDMTLCYERNVIWSAVFEIKWRYDPRTCWIFQVHETIVQQVRGSYLHLMTLSEVKFSQRMSALQNKQKTRKRILPFVTEYRPSMPDLKNILMNKWHLIQNQLSLRKIFKNPLLLQVKVSYRKRRSMKDVLVRVSEFPILNNRSRVRAVYTLQLHFWQF